MGISVKGIVFLSYTINQPVSAGHYSLSLTCTQRVACETFWLPFMAVGCILFKDANNSRGHGSVMHAVQSCGGLSSIKRAQVVPASPPRGRPELRRSEWRRRWDTERRKVNWFCWPSVCGGGGGRRQHTSGWIVGTRIYGPWLAVTTCPINRESSSLRLILTLSCLWMPFCFFPGFYFFCSSSTSHKLTGRRSVSPSRSASISLHALHCQQGEWAIDIQLREKEK